MEDIELLAAEVGRKFRREMAKAMLVPLGLVLAFMLCFSLWLKWADVNVAFEVGQLHQGKRPVVVSAGHPLELRNLR